MQVRIVQTGHCEAPGQIHDPRALSDQGLDIGVGATGHDLVAQDRNRLRDRISVTGPNLAAMQNEIGLVLRIHAAFFFSPAFTDVADIDLTLSGIPFRVRSDSSPALDVTFPCHRLQLPAFSFCRRWGVGDHKANSVFAIKHAKFA
ncbi:hypothetical protein [Mesorhizobium sp. ORM16]|uniref:hypothetical protein n=1 Tax=Mesorhizobium sp. ORM16 TaxID=3376989 RepID=UPI003857A86F